VEIDFGPKKYRRWLEGAYWYVIAIVLFVVIYEAFTGAN
jgi:hypothetical protein